MNWLAESVELVQTFLRTGGVVLYAITVVLFVLWALMLERCWYLLVSFPLWQKALLKRWFARSDQSSWQAGKIRQAWLAQAELKLKQNMLFLNVLIKICPLLGLLGTVTGMIHVFDVVAVYGTGNPRLLASGISMATIPTMAGLVCALSGMLIWSRLDSRGKKLLADLTHRLGLSVEERNS